MTTLDYSTIDAEIMAEIGLKKISFTALATKLETSAKAFCLKPKDEPHRVIDRRLQALRKQGKIGYDSKNGWTLRSADGSYINRN